MTSAVPGEVVELPPPALVALSRGLVSHWGRGAADLLGWEADEVIGRGFASALAAPEAATALDEAAGAVDGVRRIALTLRHRDMTWVPVEVLILARDSEITLLMARQPASTTDATAARLVADAAHQLLGPLAGIQASVEAVLLQGPGEEREGLLANLYRETARAGRLMRSLLLLARLDEGEGPTPLECDVVRVCQEEADRMASLTPGLDFTLRAFLPHPPLLDGDAIREVLANVLDNARRHATSGVEIELTHMGPDLEVRVRDDGGGVASGKEEQIFERFASLDGRGGSGLGLSIARGLARAHGGDLTYEAGAFVLRVPGALHH